ncbi:MAG: RdgB/HAM1 family non-canonical purine NTP pyrophosphatase [Ruminococcus sp.]|nr:RdgB/HAM1 family non-canonical purine NTP pyrophosphatase [Ruminococcus sp.]
MKLVIASNNKGKLREFSELLLPLGYEVLSQKEAGFELDVVEDGITFEENSAKKARALYELSKTAVLADDSGLEVDALNNAPGVYSARYGGEGLDDKGRTQFLLSNMKDVPDDKRDARFVCVIHFIKENGEEITVRGECKGKIGYEPKGENGFGYDPVFVYGDKTFAEHTAEFKNKVSHRAKALGLLVEKLK